MRTRVSEADLTLSGSTRSAANSARAGFLPIPLRRVPSSALRTIAVYLRPHSEQAGDSATDKFVLYRSPTVTFTPDDRERLLDNGRQFIYIPTADQARFQRQAEQALAETASDPAREFSERSAMVYETGVELMNEVLSDPDLPEHAQRIQGVSRAVTTLVLNDPQAFGHLFAASHHDFYTATHMVNVATWMVPVSYALGYRDEHELSRICQAGLLHDLGKVLVPAEILNKREQLSEADWSLIREHPTLGGARLAALSGPDPLILAVVCQHHERPDGSGYPDGLCGEQIHRVSRICAVVDSFDAMTALRPFKRHALCISDAIIAIKAGVPTRYDPEIVAAWLALLNQVDDRQLATSATPQTGAPGRPQCDRRRNKRFACDCPAQVHVLQRTPNDGWSEGPGTQTLVHSISRFGLGLLTPVEVAVGQRLRVYYWDAGGAERVIHGESVRCRAYDDGWFDIGVELIRPT